MYKNVHGKIIEYKYRVVENEFFSEPDDNAHQTTPSIDAIWAHSATTWEGGVIKWPMRAETCVWTVDPPLCKHDKCTQSLFMFTRWVRLNSCSHTCTASARARVQHYFLDGRQTNQLFTPALSVIYYYAQSQVPTRARVNCVEIIASVQ
jgi:hypothetical protein